MIAFVRHLLGWAANCFRSRGDLILENLALRQQLLALHAKRPRPRMNLADEASWLALRRLWPGWLHCLFMIGHDRRSILHCNVTRNPCGFWTVLQLPQTWQFDVPHKFLIFDRDSKFSSEVVSTIKEHGIAPVRTSFRSPWQNGVAARWVGNIRRELLDHVIVLNERRLDRDYVLYYHEDRTHLSLRKQTPNGRTARAKSSPVAKVVAFPRLGGLHHRYDIAA